MISQARLKRKTHASPNGIASGLKRKREDDEETVDARVKRQYEYIQEGGGEALVVVNTRGNLLRSIPFLMSGHLNVKIFKTLCTSFFNTNPKT